MKDSNYKIFSFTCSVFCCTCKYQFGVFSFVWKTVVNYMWLMCTLTFHPFASIIKINTFGSEFSWDCVWKPFDSPSVFNMWLVCNLLWKSERQKRRIHPKLHYGSYSRNHIEIQWSQSAVQWWLCGSQNHLCNISKRRDPTVFKLSF